MVATKSDRAHAGADRRVRGEEPRRAGGLERTYLAIASPPPPAAPARCARCYGRHPVAPQEVLVARSRPASRRSRTGSSSSRSHGAALRAAPARDRPHPPDPRPRGDHGWPLLGDPVYGHKPRDRAARRRRATALGAPGAARRRARVRPPGHRRAPLVRVAAAARSARRARGPAVSIGARAPRPRAMLEG